MSSRLSSSRDKRPNRQKHSVSDILVIAIGLVFMVATVFSNLSSFIGSILGFK